jgi:Bifunctional DNA primase/polymerase, N-terminal
MDCYDGKPGAATLAEAEGKWGELPSAPMSTSRDDGSGIRLFRVPLGFVAPIVLGEGVEIVQWFHRYLVGRPSRHPDTGQQYHWDS